MSSLPAVLDPVLVQAGTFIGRDRELQEIKALLDEPYVRFLTLTGAAGIGKTRLALEAASQVAGDYDDGVAYVSLSSVHDPQLVIPTVAEALNVTESVERSVFGNLIEYLRDKNMLLVLDNLEQVAPASGALTELLLRCRNVRLIVTSRALLGARGEHQYQVPVLGLPSPDMDEVSQLARSEAVQLFIDRALTCDSSFVLTEENAAAVRGICIRLDGLPLAIELAAKHAKELTPAELLHKLDSRLEILTSDSPDLPERQRTLRAALDWGYDLLGIEERKVFRRLCVFSGFTAEDARLISLGEDLDVDGIIQGLVNKSLITKTASDAHTRYSILRTLREYGIEQLELVGEGAATRDAHAQHYLALAQTNAAALKSVGQLDALATFDRESNNLRDALRWAANSNNGLLELELCNSIGSYWEFRAHFTEGQRWIDDALERGADAPAAMRGECMRLGSALARGQGEFARASRLIEGAMELLEQVGESSNLADAIKQRGLIAVNQGDVETGRRMFEQTLEMRERLKDPQGTADLLNNLGYIARLNGDQSAAERYFERAVREYQDHGDLLGSVRVMMNMGELKLEQGDYSGAKGFVRGSLVLCRKIDSRWDYADLLELMAAVQHGYGRVDDAARLLGAASAVREELGAPIPPAETEIYVQRLMEVRKSLGDETFDALWSEGAAMELQQAIDYALS